MSEQRGFERIDRKAENSMRELFSMRGYKETEVSKFEEYSLYIDYKNFLKTDRLVTFMDTQGKLMALKPDITLSIVKNISKKMLSFSQKLYYVDEVLRVSKENNEYKMIKQIGVEQIGNLDIFSKIEILDLALNCLSIISEDYILNISHLDFVGSFLDALSLSANSKERALNALYTKSTHDLKKILESNQVEEENIKKAVKLIEINSNIVTATKMAEELIISDEMQSAYDELVLIVSTLEKANLTSKISLDFSVVSDLDYYNGIMFLGYVKGFPKAVLSGGEYGSLLNKMTNENNAMGFAVTLSDLNSYIENACKFDFDILIKYSDSADYMKLLNIVEDFNSKGKSVRLESANSSDKDSDIKVQKTYMFQENNLKEVEL